MDLTYRLYDYGRPRELHLDEAVAVARPEPFTRSETPRPLGAGRTALCAGEKLRLERFRGPGEYALPEAAWLAPLAGTAAVDGEDMKAGSVWMTDAAAKLELGHGADVVAAFAEPA